ncbi:MAG TPA: hypothetical protein DCY74_09890, partial [Clostridiales bacterium]|nr:hypothetical protein [Clostridiales bacterium]
MKVLNGKCIVQKPHLYRFHYLSNLLLGQSKENTQLSPCKSPKNIAFLKLFGLHNRIKSTQSRDKKQFFWLHIYNACATNVQFRPIFIQNKQKNKASDCYIGSLKLLIFRCFKPYLKASSSATAHATVAPTIGLLP